MPDTATTGDTADQRPCRPLGAQGRSRVFRRQAATAHQHPLPRHPRRPAIHRPDPCLPHPRALAPADECEAALDRMIAARDEPTPPTKRGRKRRRISP